MAETEKDTIVVHAHEMSAEEIKQHLREVRALIVRLIGSTGHETYTGLELSNALYTIQYLTEDANLIDG